ncbi:hypothetical protein ANO11243_059360 [Dothideomycetidae sp. 11243]|nr:hypothetical protein ANO11243_059360 [fungal sp. No.11243]
MNRAAHNTTTAPSRRRSARHLDDDHEDSAAPPAKKVKPDTSDKRTMTTGGAARVNGATTRKGKKAYEEVDDGFSFSRSRTKRGAAKVDAPEPLKPAQEQRPSETNTTQAKKRSRKTLPTTPERDDAPKPRRSKRLSGENEDNTAGLEDPFTNQAERTATQTRPTTASRLAATAARDESPALPNGVQAERIHVPKRRETKIGLVFSETPVIRRNKAMRQTSHDSNRRSSAGLRGKRASSLIDTGASSAMPHTEVLTEDFYKHIGQSILEPRRMKQLLVWCGNRALGEKLKLGEKVKEGERQAVHAARVVQEELLADFATRNTLSNWFDRPDDSAQGVSSLVKKPNPRNIQNAAKLAELEAELARLQSEKSSWDALVASVPPSARQEPATADAQPAPLDPASIDASLLSPSQASILTTLLQPTTSDPASSSDPAAQLQSRLDSASSGLRFKLDLYHDSLHRLERYVATAGRVADDVLARSASRLEERDAQRRERAAPGQPNVKDRDVLRALGKALEKEPKRS